MTSSRIEDKEGPSQDPHSDCRNNSNSSSNKDNSRSLEELTEETGVLTSSIRAMLLEAITTLLYPWTLTAEE